MGGRPCAAAPAVPAWLTRRQTTGKGHPSQQPHALTSRLGPQPVSDPAERIQWKTREQWETSSNLPRPPGSPSENPRGKHACRGLSLIWTLVFLLAMGGLVGQHFSLRRNLGYFYLAVAFWVCLTIKSRFH